MSCRDLCVLGLGTQNASEDDHIQDAGQTADLIEEADRCQQPQGSASGLDDDAELHDMSSLADDQIVTSDHMPNRVEDGNQTHNHRWPSALVMHPSDAADEAAQLQGTAFQQGGQERVTGSQQADRAHQGFHPALRGPSSAQHSGYQNMNGHSSFNPSKVQNHFRRSGVSAEAVEDAPACVNPLHSNVAVGFAASFSRLFGSCSVTIPTCVWNLHHHMLDVRKSLHVCLKVGAYSDKTLG